MVWKQAWQSGVEAVDEAAGVDKLPGGVASLPGSVELPAVDVPRGVDESSGVNVPSACVNNPPRSSAYSS